MAYDVILDVTEGSAGSLVVRRGQEYLYGPSEMQLLLDVYLNLLETFSRNVRVQPNEVKLFADRHVNAALEAGRGKYTGNPRLHYLLTCYRFRHGI